MKRYDLEYPYEYSESPEMKESTDGDWVRWDDVKPYLEALLKLKISLGDISVAVDNVGWCNLSNTWDEIKSMGIEDE